MSLPGILSERFFKTIDENKDGYIDQKEFMKAMFKVYYSSLETKFKIVFDMYSPIALTLLIGTTSIKTVR